MAKVKKIYYEGALVYPLTITDAVLDPETNEQLSVIIKNLRKTSYGIIDIKDINKYISDENSN